MTTVKACLPTTRGIFQVQRPALVSVFYLLCFASREKFLWLVNLERIIVYTQLQVVSMATIITENEGLFCFSMPSIFPWEACPVWHCHAWWVRLRATSSNMVSLIVKVMLTLLSLSFILFPNKFRSLMGKVRAIYYVLLWRPQYLLSLLLLSLLIYWLGKGERAQILNTFHHHASGV